MMPMKKQGAVLIGIIFVMLAREIHSSSNKLVTYSFSPGSALDFSGVENETRVLMMNRVSRGGCPYTASFLCTSKRFVQSMKFGLKWQKMEAANWNAISSHTFKYQLHNISSFFVNHMSAFEHATRKKFGYAKSEEMTLMFSNEAVQGECSNIEHQEGYLRSVMAFVPFYGGRPPNVTADLKVKSIGQGNSLVKAEIKALQTQAVVCSLLRHFGSVVVGVTRPEDLVYMETTLKSLSQEMVSSRVKVLLLKTHKPANLPFALLEWGRIFVRQVNECLRELGGESKLKKSKMRKKTGFIGKMLKDSQGLTESSSLQSSSQSSNSSACNHLFPTLSNFTLSHVYYTESDQILSFSDASTRRAIVSASNGTTFVIGRRMEKIVKDSPADYMENLIPTRALCGDPKKQFVLEYPRSRHILQVRHGSSNAI